MLLLYAYSRKAQSLIRFRWVALSIVALRTVTVLLFAVTVWCVWRTIPLGRILLAQPLGQAVPFLSVLRPVFAHPGGYFAFYIIGRYVFPFVTLLCVAGLLAGTMVLLRKIRSVSAATMSTDEPLLMFTTACVTDWPGVILFIPAWILIEIISNLYSLIVRKQVSLATSLALAATVTIILGPILFSSLYAHVLVF